MALGHQKRILDIYVSDVTVQILDILLRRTGNDNRSRRTRIIAFEDSKGYRLSFESDIFLLIDIVI